MPLDIDEKNKLYQWLQTLRLSPVIKQKRFKGCFIKNK